MGAIRMEISTGYFGESSQTRSHMESSAGIMRDSIVPIQLIQLQWLDSVSVYVVEVDVQAELFLLIETEG